MADVKSKPVPIQTNNLSTKIKSQPRIGPYILGKTLGIGSTGRVKLGTHLETNQKVAIKIIQKQALKKNEDDASKSTLKKLEREIAIMKLVQHPLVLQLYDVYESQEELYLILELVEGGELFDFLVKKGKLNEDEALNFFQQLMQAIDFCHRHLICHRDLKPENILLDGQKNIKVADFGMSSLQHTGKMLETSSGSPHYACPEIIKGVQYDGQPADIWSCGVILFALLTGNLPFDDDNIRKLLQKVKSGVFKIPSHVSPEAADLIQRMITVNPKERITMEEIYKHPWFTRKPLKEIENLKLPPDSTQLKSLQPDDIDPEIVNSLKALGYGEEDQIIKSLTSSEPKDEKVFYWVLEQRKYDYMENYVEEKDWWLQDGKTTRRRMNSQDSRQSLIEKSSSMYGSSDLLSGRLTPKANSQSDLNKKPYQPSPLSSKVSTVDENSVLAGPNEKLNALTISTQIEKPLVDDQSLGTPRFHRQHYQVPVTPISEMPKSPMADINQSNGNLNSPQISAGPKKSWFENIFKYKSGSFQFLSSDSLVATREKLESQLKSMEVPFQTSSSDPNSLKCKFTNRDQLPVVKFKITLSEMENQMILLHCVQQQGALSTLQTFISEFKNVWMPFPQQ